MNAKLTLTPDQRRALLTHPAGWIATGFGAGFTPRAQGTVGSLLALLPWWLLWRDLSAPAYGLMLILAFAVGVWACGESSRRIGFPDHRALVWDEFLGQWVALLPILAAPSWWMVALGFALFRLFDVWKPWPIRWFDRRIKGGAGVMLDDLIAGIFAAIPLAIIHTFLL